MERKPQGGQQGRAGSASRGWEQALQGSLCTGLGWEEEKGSRSRAMLPAEATVPRVSQADASGAGSVSPPAFSWEFERPTQSLGEERACVVLAVLGNGMHMEGLSGGSGLARHLCRSAEEGEGGSWDEGAGPGLWASILAGSMWRDWGDLGFLMPPCHLQAN